VFQQPRTLASASPLWKVGDACEACFSEDQVWYVAKIDKISPDHQAFTVIYLEYGNSEVLSLSALRPLPSTQTQVSTKKKEEKEKKTQIFFIFAHCLPLCPLGPPCSNSSGAYPRPCARHRCSHGAVVQNRRRCRGLFHRGRCLVPRSHRPRDSRGEGVCDLH